jgi:hypothetical protein
MTLGHKPHTTHLKPIILGLAALLTISIAPTAQATDKITQVTNPTTDNAIQTPAPAAEINNPGQEVTAPATSNMPVSLDQPNLKSDAVLTWASEAAKSVYSYDFKNNKKQIQIDQQYFTPAGWRAFMEALNKSNNLKIVGEKKLVASATPNGNPTVLEEGVKNGHYVWKIVVPLLATYENESKLIKQNLLVTMLITRTNTPKGIGISHFIAEVVPSNQLSQLIGPQPVMQPTTNQPTVNPPTNPSAITPSPQTTVPSLPSQSQPQPGNVPAPMNNTMPPYNNPNAPQPGMPQTQMPPMTSPPAPSSPVRSY